MNPPMQTTTTAAPKRRVRKGVLRRLLAPAVIVALVAAIAWGLRPQPVAVELDTVSEGPFTMSVIEEGKTRIRQRYIVSPPVAGMLRRIPLRAGAKVEAGKTVLAEVEATPVAMSARVRRRRRASARRRRRSCSARRWSSTRGRRSNWLKRNAGAPPR
jgi:HlyD family secretion protein